jgi:DNA-binding CsgD family transcriptional regulator
MTTETVLPAASVLTALSHREHQYLWLVSQGHTPRQAFQVMGTGSAPSVATRIKKKLSARTMEHAVFIGVMSDLLGPFMYCGTLDGYREHQSRGDTDPCRACRRAFTEYAERQQTPVLKKVILTDPELKLLRQFDSGRSFKDVLRIWGCSRRTLDGVRMSLYRKLDVTHLPQQSKQATAVETGRRLGYLRPEPFLPLEEIVIKAEQPRLTELEVRTLGLLGAGASLREAGEVLGIAGSAVSSKLARIYEKLDVLHHAHGERREAALHAARQQGYPV